MLGEQLKRLARQNKTKETFNNRIMELIDKDALMAEIERQQRKLCVLSQYGAEIRKDASIQNGVYCSLLSFIDTLEVKEADF